jgi:hypothetical protein
MYVIHRSRLNAMQIRPVGGPTLKCHCQFCTQLVLYRKDFLNKQILYNCVSHFVTPELWSSDIQGNGVQSLCTECKQS